MPAKLDRDLVLKEFEGVDLGDARRNRRLDLILARAAQAPAESFPDQMDTEAEQEALYRFLANPNVTMDALLAGHRQQTRDRIREHRLVRIVHDTTELSFEGEREGLGILRRGRKGFLVHTALAVGGNDDREPLGVIGVHPFVNKDVLENRRLTTAQQTAKKKAQSRAEKKSSRWERLVIDVGGLVPPDIEAIHVMDQEADDYTVFSALLAAKQRFVIRAEAKRFTANGDSIGAVLDGEAANAFRLVQITARSKKQATKQHPARDERLASLNVRWTRVTLARPQSAAANTAEELSLWAVHVFEPSPPPGEIPIDWTLLTSERVEDFDAAVAVVDHYRTRWLIEEYFKALKTGCAIEKRQLCSLDGLLRALGLFIPMAWTLLVLRYLGQQKNSRAAGFVLNVNQLLLLRAMLDKRGRSFPQRPTVRDAMLGIAALGGHIKNNGDPGWLVLGRGFRKFAEAEEVWELATTAGMVHGTSPQRSDQS